MAFEKTIPLNEFITLQRGFDLPQDKRIKGDIPVIASTGIVGYHNEEKVQAPGVVIGRSGSIGGGQYITNNFWPLNTTLWVKDFKGHHPRFVYYLLKSIDFSQFNVGSGVPTLNRNHLSGVLVADTSYSYEKEVSNVIGTLDDKINLNKKINQTLEQMSQTLFKSWFVDFDPVIDNALDAGNPIPEALQIRAELRQKVHNSADFKPLPTEIRSLFPSEFEETELGWVPKGWCIKDFSVIAKLIKDNVKSENICDDIHYIGLEHLERKHIFITNYGNGGDVSSNKSAFDKNDLLFGKLRPYFHKVALAPFSGICSTDILVFRAKENIYRSLMAMYAFTDDFVAYANLRSTGTRMPRAEAKDLLNYKIVLPNKNVLEKFEVLLENYWIKGQLNNYENEKLIALRDTLLPKLISGELSVEDLPDLIKQTEAA
ncbi:restriction endonuclease subunit S [Escherichia sp. E13S3]|uniref:restriction endonuclease subunit S n=1 Tax=Escherichia sp. E13S3 TaxID=2484854 RepID=UPI00102906EF|nr:restriction endonuclease subunit S [Escherichia sp. E13S3]RZN51487.1 restriction endonuclease subunit S [Escherichia sp. E13S3]